MAKQSIKAKVDLAMGKPSPKLNKMEAAKQTAKSLREASELSASYCRKCNKMLPYRGFWKSTTPYLDTNGRLSICINCANKMFDENYIIYNDYKRAIFMLCQYFDMLYDEEIAKTVEEYMQKERKDGSQKYTAFGKYNFILNRKYVNQSTRFSNTKIENDFHDSTTPKDIKAEMLEKWGEWSESDYNFLEKKLNEYLKTYGGGELSEVDSYKTYVILLLRQRNDPSNKDITAAIREQMKLLGITPEQLQKRNQDKGKMIIGVEAEIIELTRPCEVYENKELYFDHDSLQRDMQDVKRCIKNFKTGSKDFDSEGVDISEVFDDSEE